MIRLAHSIGVDRIQVMNLVPYVAAQKFKMLYYHRSLANQYFQEGRRVAQELNFDVNIPPDFGSGTFETTPLLQVGLPGKKAPLIQTISTELVNCYYPWQTCSINELGNVKPCCVYWRLMGTLKRGFDAVWNGRAYRRLRASINTKPDHICYTCRQPRFDSDENKSAAQLMPGVREIVGNLLTIRRRKTTFSGILNPEYDPTGRQSDAGRQPCPSAAPVEAGASGKPCCS
jgi:hypothetical protein